MAAESRLRGEQQGKLEVRRRETRVGGRQGGNNREGRQHSENGGEEDVKRWEKQTEDGLEGWGGREAAGIKTKAIKDGTAKEWKRRSKRGGGLREHCCRGGVREGEI